MPIKSFRGLIADNVQDTITLHTNDGSVGYKIIKFQILPQNFNITDEYNVKIFKVQQSTNTTTFDFSDNTLLAGAYFENSLNVGAEGSFEGTVVFDNEIFNQDIYVSAKSQSGGAVNYYIELEQINLSLDQNTVATLKDIRNIEQPSV